ncbi:hypothetical protein [Helicobacter macacae]|uniref:hypothetical protein n=1 Tax=Helicobacter macacae TaxID=398626 RepID=UPI0012EB119A|nr:hypothetical protein [Helicobacter macacae]
MPRKMLAHLLAMTNLSTLLLTQKIPTTKPPPQREGALGSFPTSQSICHTTIHCHT